jgi:hypothetical protein
VIVRLPAAGSAFFARLFSTVLPGAPWTVGAGECAPGAVCSVVSQFPDTCPSGASRWVGGHRHLGQYFGRSLSGAAGPSMRHDSRPSPPATTGRAMDAVTGEPPSVPERVPMMTA